ncbi:expressed unknown protein [Seminavis robusta]|uniref:Uncharacterized protein n=1 Tax=Seminavis robusta TaxID=568900 RepID=A0A9N8D9R9_9STRA|nr:expressed unknown protein [Seminavis robusta]|eukprot:Sro6_g005210.1 n/a (426) ;mRNA; r:125482-126759
MKFSIFSIGDLLSFRGAFRLDNSQPYGISSLDYAIGTMAFHPTRNSLFIAGHDHHRAIAEYSVMEDLDFYDQDSNNNPHPSVQDLPVTPPPLQAFVYAFEGLDNRHDINRITGMMVVDDVLFVNAENWYDASLDEWTVTRDTSLYFPMASNLSAAAPVGFFQLEGGSQAAGYMGRIPSPLQPLFNDSKFFTGWSSVYSILSRYSQGPSLWTFEPQEMIERENGSSSIMDRKENSTIIAATPYMNYPYSHNDPSKWLSERATEWVEPEDHQPTGNLSAPPADPLWNPLSEARYAFFVQDEIFCVIGITAGLESGIGYKVIQENGHECGGPCPFVSDDWYNYYWLYHVQEIVNASFVWDPRPFAYGVWELPYYVTVPSEHRIIGGTVDEERGILFVALANAGKLDEYDQPPLILMFDILEANQTKAR